MASSIIVRGNKAHSLLPRLPFARRKLRDKRSLAKLEMRKEIRTSFSEVLILGLLVIVSSWLDSVAPFGRESKSEILAGSLSCVIQSVFILTEQVRY